MNINESNLPIAMKEINKDELKTYTTIPVGKTACFAGILTMLSEMSKDSSVQTYIALNSSGQSMTLPYIRHDSAGFSQTYHDINGINKR